MHMKMRFETKTRGSRRPRGCTRNTRNYGRVRSLNCDAIDPKWEGKPNSTPRFVEQNRIEGYGTGVNPSPPSYQLIKEFVRCTFISPKDDSARMDDHVPRYGPSLRSAMISIRSRRHHICSFLIGHVLPLMTQELKARQYEGKRHLHDAEQSFELSQHNGRVESVGKRCVSRVISV